MSARRRLSSLLALLSVVAGCARALPPPREPIGPAARQAIDLLVARQQEFHDLRTLATIVVQKNGSRQQLNGVLLAREPTSARFEALSPMGQPLLVVVINDGELRSYNATNGEALVGPATPDTSARLLGLPLEPDDLVAVLGGLAAVPSDLRAAEVAPPDDHGPSLDLYGAVHRTRVWMDMTTGIVQRLAIVGGRFEVIVDYQRGADGKIAGFDMDAGHGVVTASVRYRDPAINGGVDPERFTLTLPEGARIERLR